jgi:hypothetical protein
VQSPLVALAIPQIPSRTNLWYLLGPRNTSLMLSFNLPVHTWNHVVKNTMPVELFATPRMMRLIATADSVSSKMTQRPFTRWHSIARRHVTVICKLAAPLGFAVGHLISP